MRRGNYNYNSPYDPDDPSIQTYTGKQIHLLHPRPEDIDIVDIAWALSNTCRYGGHCRRFYSVAEHSVYVSNAVPPMEGMWGLLHDAAEAYLVDLPTPLKSLLPGYQMMERDFMRVITKAFGLCQRMPDNVRLADHNMMMTEIFSVMGGPVFDWGLVGFPFEIDIEFWNPPEAYARFMNRWNVLMEEGDRPNERER